MKIKYLSFDEIVFEKRNKDYGAFSLRKIYNKVVGRAFFFGTTLFLSVLAIPLVANYLNKHERNLENYISADFEDLKKPDPIMPPNTPKPPDPVKSEERVAFKAPIATYDSTETVYLGELIDNTINTIIDTKKGDGDLEDKGNGDLIKIEEEKPLIIVGLMPKFVGGDEEMYRYLSENIKYPVAAKEAGIAGTVVVTFVVEKDGNITDVQTLKDIGGGCGAEAVRVVSGMPKWNVGKQNGVPVRVQFNLPILFTLQ